MKKIEPVAYMTYKGYLLHAKDPKVKEHSEPAPLYTDDAMQAVAEAMLSKVQEEINKHVILDEESRSDIMFNRGLDKADAIVGDFDITSLINQMKGHIPSESAT